MKARKQEGWVEWAWAWSPWLAMALLLYISLVVYKDGYEEGWKEGHDTGYEEGKEGHEPTTWNDR